MSNTPPNAFPPLPPINITPIKVPSNIPVAWLGTISSVAGVIAFVVVPIVHRYFPEIPTLDATAVQTVLGVLISVAIAVHNSGWQTILKSIISNITPQIVQSVETAVASQMQNNASVGPLSMEDVVAIKHARYRRMQNPHQVENTTKEV